MNLPQKEKNREYKKQWHRANKERVSKIKKESYQNNKQQILQKNKKYRQENREIILEGKRNYYRNNKEVVALYLQNNRDQILQRKKEYRISHKEKIKEYDQKHKDQRNQTIKERKKQDINFKIKCNLRTRLYQAIVGIVKFGSAVRDMGCSIEFLKEYFKPMFIFIPQANEMMSWENYPRLWEIDHIIPLSAFDLTNREELLKAVHYSNLRPMWTTQNRREQDRGMSLSKKGEKWLG